jgi:hypothetical protein
MKAIVAVVVVFVAIAAVVAAFVVKAIRTDHPAGEIEA